MFDQNHLYQKFKFSLLLPLGFLAILWIIQILQTFGGVNLVPYGILPLHFEGLKGVITAPMVHGDFLHLFNNSIPFIVGSVMMIFFYRRIAVVSFVLIYILTGIAVWFFGKPAYHIGLSGVVYGLISFIFWMGIFRRNLKSIALALVVAFLYSGMLYGVFPVKEGVSWESHLFGAVSGAVVAFIFRNRYEYEEEDELKYVEEAQPEQFFFKRDVFEKTKEERRRELEDPWTRDHTF